jgi:hypothetical protein
MGELGRLVRVDLREEWENEATKFTPWLALEENIQLLGDTIGIDLEVEAQEQHVGPFRADILCKDTATGSWVLIENQLEQTDHTHLGQIITYAAGLEAVIIVWIAKSFTEEHRAALDWLNEIAAGKASLFGLEIELWRVDDSRAAPKFNVVSKPNKWSETVKATADGGDLSDMRKLQLEYWTQFRQFMEEGQSIVRCPKPGPQGYMIFAIGRSHFYLVARMNTQDGEIGVYLNIYGPDKQAHYELLQRKYKTEIESQIELTLDWRALPEAKESHIETSKDANPTDRNDWSAQHEWIKNTLETFHRVLSPIIKKLDASEYEEPSGLPDAPG